MNTPPDYCVVVTDHGFADLAEERRVLEPAGCTLAEARCRTAEEVAVAARDADALLVQWAPVTAGVIATLDRVKVVVRYGIGVDNVALDAARRAGIPDCNVPDYCVDEVADHTLALALALGRQLAGIDRRTRDGVWKLAPVTPMPAFREMRFVTVGFGRIARAVLSRARPFGFRLGAYDPYVPEDTIGAGGVEPVPGDRLFEEADVLSLHLPLTPETRHFVGAAELGRMKPASILVNTSRGLLVDTGALARALQAGVLAGAGLDVFETEPLPVDHPLRRCETALLTSHVAWYSEQSVPRLQRMAAEEVLRALRGEPLRNQVNG